MRSPVGNLGPPGVGLRCVCMGRVCVFPGRRMDVVGSRYDDCSPPDLSGLPNFPPRSCCSPQALKPQVGPVTTNNKKIPNKAVKRIKQTEQGGTSQLTDHGGMFVHQHLAGRAIIPSSPRPTSTLHPRTTTLPQFTATKFMYVYGYGGIYGSP